MQSDVKKIAKSILDGSYDQKREDDWVNTVVYRNLPKHEKTNFRAKHLNHLSLYYLDEVAIKRQQKREKMALIEASKAKKEKKRLEVARKPSWMLKHKKQINMLTSTVTTPSFSLRPSPAERSKASSDSGTEEQLLGTQMDVQTENQTLMDVEPYLMAMSEGELNADESSVSEEGSVKHLMTHPE